VVEDGFVDPVFVLQLQLMGFSCIGHGRWEEGAVGLQRLAFGLNKVWVWAINGTSDVYGVVSGEGNVAQRSDDCGDFGVQQGGLLVGTSVIIVSGTPPVSGEGAQFC